MTTKAIEKSEIEQFIKLATNGLNSIREAGILLCNLIDKDNSCLELICKMWPGVSEEVLRGFERVGRGKWLPQLTWLDKPVCRVLRMVPVELQEKYLSSPVELLISQGEPLMVDSLNLLPGQVSQVFDKNGLVRSIPAQRAWLESGAAKKARVTTKYFAETVEVSGRNLVIRFGHKELKLSRKQLATYLAQMES